MNRKKYIPILRFLAAIWLFGCASEDPNSLDTSEIFIKYYGTDAAEEAIDLIELSDGFLLLGSRTDVDNTDFYLVRTDSAGNRIWEGIIDNEEHDEGQASIDIPSRMYYDEANQTLFVVGTSTFDIEEDGVGKLEENHLMIANVQISNTGFTVADTLIYRYFDDRVSDDTNYSASRKATSGVDILPIGTDELLILGSVDAGSDDPIDTDNSIFLMRIGTDLDTANIDWERVKGFQEDDFGRSLVVTNNRYFYMASMTTTTGSAGNIGNGGTDVLVEEFNPTSGEAINQREYGTSNNDEGVNMIYTNPGIAIVGTTGAGSTQYAFLLRISSNLGAAQIRTLTYENTNSSSSGTWNTQGADVAVTSSGNYYVVGTVNSFSDAAQDPREDEVVLLPTNSIGEVNEGDVQEYGSVQSDAGRAIIRRADGSMVIGATVHFGGSATMMSLMKTNKNGEFLRN